MRTRYLTSVVFALVCVVALSWGAAPGVTADMSSVYVANDSSGTVVVHRDGEQVCTLEASKSCMVKTPKDGSSTFRFVYADGRERTISWDGTLHLCIKDGGRITNCGPQEY